MVLVFTTFGYRIHVKASLEHGLRGGSGLLFLSACEYLTLQDDLPAKIFLLLLNCFSNCVRVNRPYICGSISRLPILLH